jgi:hypothetical protein
MMTTTLAAVATFALLKRGFDFVMEKTVSYFAKRKLEAILKEMEEAQKKSPEEQAMMDYLDAVGPGIEGEQSKRRIQRYMEEEDTTMVQWD